MYTRIYIHVDGTWCVCGALPYSFSNGLVVHKPTRPLREVECVGLREERGVGLRDWYLLIILPGQIAVSFLNVINPSMHADILPTAQHTSCCSPRPNLAAHVDRELLAACQHSRAFNLWLSGLE